ncbi:ADL228Cp [Eremothecium gossypii ATCC 10895]|uniref:Conserved oligomeric Golgi complex subunit 6 n=1 Tax=Eremothecium gossypii (strain ATCC 10895 / CBS 109.51 / FGSC 9923 / NRRL Y-1056) TaxID=284811 RepID=COG6_EREGS|nr:ADL228Cp [Eremothecium gossypii ATCC 10895]Q75AZ8.2 RecName: Full=Conserved oligomeric Golgi complex subunit 6; Short=COG complex subunit 6; AltName: Full=Component of oligomeric Golgi complex 6 [Eremothecium gossypii ATCC 10895]AAS51692.2 ADL228Cp [Eremothecium gossypii ATCC 10895]AEY95989.1 FADL228Cp [Eremothecium gossypii FDAG1]
MDFLDYQAYGVPLTGTDDELLPEPASNLSLLAASGPSVSELNTSIQGDSTPPLLNTDSNFNFEGKDNLHERMEMYSELTVKLLPIQPGLVRDIFEDVTPQSSDFQHLLKKGNNVTSAVLVKRLSHVLNDMNHPNYQSDLQLKKALMILQDNQGVLGLDGSKLVRPDFLGSLSRKTLRSQLEKELLKDHLATLENFQPIARRIMRLRQPVKNIQEISEKVLDAQEAQNKSPLQDPLVSEVREKLEMLKLKKRVLVGIRESLTLNQLEDEQLRNGEIEDSYLDVLDKMMEIKERSTYLIAMNYEKAGKALLGNINQYLQLANKRIYNYLLGFLYDYESNTKTFGERNFEGDNVGLSLFQRCLVYLSNDLEYFNDFMKKVTSMRSKKLLDEFLIPFVIDNNEGRSIILSAHDPARYLGDVLAHVHSLLANEGDFLKSLFKYQEERMADMTQSIFQKNKDILQSLHVNMLNDIMSTLSNSVRIRLEQIVRFEEEATVTFDISQLLSLYKLMFTKQGMLDDNKLVKVFDDLAVLAKTKTMNYYTEFLSEAVKEEPEVTDLLPPKWLSKYLSDLTALFDKINGSSEQTGIVDKNFFTKLVKTPCESTFLKQAELCFPLAKKDRRVKFDLLVLEINGLDMIVSRLGPYRTNIFSDEYGSEVYDSLKRSLDTLLGQLEVHQTRNILESTGLELYYNLFNMIFPVASVQDPLDYDMYLSAQENQIMKLETIETNIAQKLSDYLPKALLDVQDTWLLYLASPKFADDIASRSFHVFANFYVVFKSVLLNIFPDDHQRINSIFIYSEEEVKMLLGIN